VKLPENLKRIEKLAFEECSKLQFLEIPATVNYIAEDAFTKCENLILRVSAGTYAAQYAQKHQIRFEIVAEESQQ
jgi:hypothetical protein